MSKVLDNAVSSGDGETWDFRCPGLAGSVCGDPATGVPFHSTGWPTKKAAKARGAQHFAEHKGEGVTQSLHEFRRDQGLVVNDDGSVSVEDI
jgi:hypothetical protein